MPIIFTADLPPAGSAAALPALGRWLPNFFWNTQVGRQRVEMLRRCFYEMPEQFDTEIITHEGFPAVQIKWQRCGQDSGAAILLCGGEVSAALLLAKLDSEGAAALNHFKQALAVLHQPQDLERFVSAVQEVTERPLMVRSINATGSAAEVSVEWASLCVALAFFVDREVIDVPAAAP